MTFAHPLAIGLVALAAPIVFAYMYKRHRSKRNVSSALLLRIIRDERPAAARSRSRLKHRISLALVLGALLAALAALIGPRTEVKQGGRTVILLDRSASMGTRDGRSDRLALAAETAADIAETADSEREVALVVAGGDPSIVVAPTKNHADVVAAADAIAKAGARGDNRDDATAFRLAEGLCRDPQHTDLVIISDGAGMSAPPLACPTRAVSVGKTAENVGITAFSVRPLDGLGLYDVHVGVGSTSDQTRHVNVTLTSNGEVADVVALEVPPHGDTERTVRVTVDKAGGALHAAITRETGDPTDALALDDSAEAPLTDAGPVHVLLVTARKHSLVAEAFRIHPRVTLDIAQPGHLPPEAHDLIVLESPPAAPLPPAAHVVALGVSPGDDAPVSLGAAAEQRQIVRWDFDAPWFRYVDLHELILTKAQVVAGGKTVVDSASGPIVASAAWGDRELLVTGFSVDETDLTLRAAFPNLVANLVDWAAPPVAAKTPIGVLATAETHLAPHPILSNDAHASTMTAGGTTWTDLLRWAVLAAIALLLVEQTLLAFSSPFGKRPA
ncbi:MAG TPA: BatA and WFA domain-containing protein [Kofleriaceae bacterium]|jgi:hypothetical protein